AAKTPKRLRSPLAAAKPAKGMISSLGIGGNMDSASMTRKIPRYPNSEMVWMIQSVMRQSPMLCAGRMAMKAQQKVRAPTFPRGPYQMQKDYAVLAARLMRLRSL